MMRRGGVAALQQRQQQTAKFQASGAQLTDTLTKQMQDGLDVFKKYLEEFARKYKKEISRNPDFRRDFHKMCVDIGVDPLASNKGFWGELLGLGDFYYELGVQIIDACLSTRAINGGLMDITECLNLVLKRRGSNAVLSRGSISVDDMERAIAKLGVLGGGYKVVRIGGRCLVQSVPVELNTDHMAVIAAAEGTGYVTGSKLQTQLRWPSQRVESVLKLLLQEGLVWIDTQAADEQFWFPWLQQNLFEDVRV